VVACSPPRDTFETPMMDAPPGHRSPQDREAIHTLYSGETNRVWARLRGIFARKRFNPEEYERVRCERCDGTGLILNGPGNVQMNEARVRHQKCGKCLGRGYVLVKKTS